MIAPVMRGCGASDRPDADYDKRTVVSALRALVRQLGFDKFDLVGHDVGMTVAYVHACDFPDTVRRLALMEAALPGPGLEALFDGEKYRRIYHLPLFEAPNGSAGALIAGRERMFVDHFIRQQAYDQNSLEPEAIDHYACCLGAPDALRPASPISARIGSMPTITARTPGRSSLCRS